MALTVYQLKVVLLDVKPAVWRRVLVPGDATIRTLHETVQVAMGWAKLIEVNGPIADDDLRIHGNLADAAEAFRHRIVDMVGQLARHGRSTRIYHNRSLFASLCLRGEYGDPVVTTKTQRHQEISRILSEAKVSFKGGVPADSPDLLVEIIMIDGQAPPQAKSELVGGKGPDASVQQDLEIRENTG